MTRPCEAARRPEPDRLLRAYQTLAVEAAFLASPGTLTHDDQRRIADRVERAAAEVLAFRDHLLQSDMLRPAPRH